MAMQDDRELVDALQFPKVAVRQGTDQHVGYLTEISAKMILVELARCGFVVMKPVEGNFRHAGDSNEP